jgi:hypothetical protein
MKSECTRYYSAVDDRISYSLHRGSTTTIFKYFYGYSRVIGQIWRYANIFGIPLLPMKAIRDGVQDGGVIYDGISSTKTVGGLYLRGSITVLPSMFLSFGAKIAALENCII